MFARPLGRRSRRESFYDGEARSVKRPVQNYAKALREGGKAAIWGRKTRCFQIDPGSRVCVVSHLKVNVGRRLEQVIFRCV